MQERNALQLTQNNTTKQSCFSHVCMCQITPFIDFYIYKFTVSVTSRCINSDGKLWAALCSLNPDMRSYD